MNMLGGSVSFLESQFQQRLVQVCLFAAILFWLLGSYKLIDQVQKLLSKVGLRFGKDSTRVVHALIFAVLLYLLTRFIMDPVVRRLSNGSVVEGQDNVQGGTPEQCTGTFCDACERHNPFVGRSVQACATAMEGANSRMHTPVSNTDAALAALPDGTEPLLSPTDFFTLMNNPICTPLMKPYMSGNTLPSDGDIRNMTNDCNHLILEHRATGR